MFLTNYSVFPKTMGRKTIQANMSHHSARIYSPKLILSNWLKKQCHFSSYWCWIYITVNSTPDLNVIWKVCGQYCFYSYMSGHLNVVALSAVTIQFRGKLFADGRPFTVCFFQQFLIEWLWLNYRMAFILKDDACRITQHILYWFLFTPLIML